MFAGLGGEELLTHAEARWRLYPPWNFLYKIMGVGCVKRLIFVQLTSDLFRVCRPRMLCKELI